MISGVQPLSSTIGGISGASSSTTSLLREAEKTADSGSLFGDLFKDAAGKVNELENQARTAVKGLMTGTGVDVHDVMIASEKASMAFEMALAVRNKAIQSYQSVMSVQF